jgi:3-isopropylmalate dehydrogenase
MTKTHYKIANPIAAINSVAMMLRHSMNLNKEADIVDQAIDQTLQEGYRTRDIAGTSSNIVTTREMGQKIADRIKKLH